MSTNPTPTPVSVLTPRTAQDYSCQNLTSWGYAEVAPDYECMGGAKMSMLILNAFPKWFKYNSVYVMQPFFTPKESEAIFTKQGTLANYSLEPPSLEKDAIPLLSHAAVSATLRDSTNFEVPWGPAIDFLMEGNKFCLAHDGPDSVKQHKDIMQAMAALPNYETKYKAYMEDIFCMLLKRESYTLGRGHQYYQVDIVREYVPPSSSSSSSSASVG